MSRKHYNATARAFKTHLDEWKGTPMFSAVEQSLHDTAADLADMFAADNEHFDRQRFMAACGFAPLPPYGGR